MKEKKLKIGREKQIKKGKKMKKNKISKKPKVSRNKGRFNIFKVKREFKIIPLLINILIPILGGFIIAYLNHNTINIYNMLKKPFFTPPNIVFQIVWTALYILMGISAYRIFMRNKQGLDDGGGYFFYLIQLIINFLWAFVFFTFRLYGVSFILLIVLIIFILITFVKFIKMDKIAGLLLIPYLMWVSYAGILNLFIWMLNEM